MKVLLYPSRALRIAAAFSVLALPGFLHAAPQLTEVAAFPKQQVTGIGVSPKTGRVFVNFPYWSDDYSVAVAEVKDGKPHPYPDARWNALAGDAATRFVCVQSVVVDDQDQLWVLDPASPKQEGVVKGGAKLVQIDLATNKVVRVIHFSDEVAPKKSYLNDVRIDHANHAAYITESGIGSLIVVDLKTGEARVALKDDPSVKGEATDLVVEKNRPIDPKTKTIPVFHADGIAFDAARDQLYFHPLTGHALYSIPAAALRKSGASEKEVAAQVKKLAETPKCDGMLEGPKGEIYLTAIEENGINRFDPATSKLTRVISDPRLKWPDTMSWGPNRELYVTTSQIHLTAQNNGGVSKISEPFRVLKLKPSAE